jgi:hypothetical protein
MGIEMEKDQPFVRHEYGENLAQSELNSQMKAEEINLVRKIELRTENLLKDLNSIEGLTNALNRNLLPQKPKIESDAKVEARKPQGWLENHLQGLDFAIYRSGQIYEQVTRLMQATKIDMK